MKDDIRQFHRTLTFKIVVVILVCSLAPLGVTTYVSLSQADGMLDHKSTARQATEVENVAGNAERRSQVFENQIRLLKDHPAVQQLARERYENESLGDAVTRYEKGTGYPKLLDGNATYERTQSYFTRVAADNPSIDMIRVFWRDGNVLSGYKLGGEDVDDYKADKGWFKDVVERNAVVEDEVYVSAINVARSTDSAAIRYAMPIVIGGEKVGLVIVNYEATQITAPVRTIELGEDGYGMLIDPAYQNAEGENVGATYVANGRDNDLEFNTSIAGDLAVPTNELSGASGELTFQQDGRTWHGQYQRLELVNGRQYYAVTAVPAAQMNAAQQSIRESSLLIAGIAALLVVGVGLFTSRRITRPINDVADDAAAVADGDLDRDIRRSTSSTEIDTLTSSIGAMKRNVVSALEDAETAKRQAEDERERAQAAKDEAERATAEAEASQEEAEAARKDAERARHEAEALSSAIESKADDYSAVMAAAANGDLTRRMDPESRSEAMAEIGEAFNEMIADLEATVVEIQAFAERVDGTSGQVTSSATEVERTSEEVSESIQDISDGAARQNENLQEVSGEMNGLSATIEEIASSASEVAGVSQRAAEVGETGSEHAAEALAEMDRIESSAAGAKDEVESLDEEMAAIGDIVELIDGIAEQTNLLALNASIEAARAGEAGQGFEIVATEIKDLAAETAEATTEIEALIENVQSSTRTTVEDVSRVQTRLSSGMDTVESALDSLDEVVEYVEEANDGIQSISDATDDQAASTEEAVAMLDEIANTSEETTAEAQNVAAASEQATSAIGEVSDHATDLSRQATDLAERLDEFEVSDDASTDPDDSEMLFGQATKATDD